MDKYGFDDNLTTRLPDNPFWDATDAAHPAWWRGHDYTLDVVVRQLHDLIDNPRNRGVSAHSELQRLRQRIMDLGDAK